MTVTDISKYKDYEDMKGIFDAIFYLATETMRKDMPDVNVILINALRRVADHIEKLGFETSNFDSIIECIDLVKEMDKEQLDIIISSIETKDSGDLMN